MKGLKIAAIALVVYAGIVTAFESMIGYFQPETGTTLVITTSDADGQSHDRVLARLESDGALYVAANHWPRRWYNQALENPQVQVAFEGQKGSYRAVPVSGAEHDRVHSENGTGLVFRLLTGFAPRKFLRLEPEGAASGRA